MFQSANRARVFWTVVCLASAAVSLCSLGVTLYSTVRTKQFAEYIACLKQGGYYECRPGWAIVADMKPDR